MKSTQNAPKTDGSLHCDLLVPSINRSINRLCSVHFARDAASCRRRRYRCCRQVSVPTPKHIWSFYTHTHISPQTLLHHTTPHLYAHRGLIYYTGVYVYTLPYHIFTYVSKTYSIHSIRSPYSHTNTPIVKQIQQDGMRKQREFISCGLLLHIVYEIVDAIHGMMCSRSVYYCFFLS